MLTKSALMSFRYESLFLLGSGYGLFFSIATPKSEQSLLHFTEGESVVTGDCRLNLSESAKFPPN